MTQVIRRIGSSCTCPHCGKHVVAYDKPTPTSRMGEYALVGKCSHLKKHTYSNGKHNFHYEK